MRGSTVVRAYSVLRDTDKFVPPIPRSPDKRGLTVHCVSAYQDMPNIFRGLLERAEPDRYPQQSLSTPRVTRH